MVKGSRFALTSLLTMAFAGTSAPAPAIDSNDLIDMAIDMVDPDLKPLRPTLVCAAGGGNLTDCAVKTGQQQLAADPDANRIIHVFQLAQDKKYPQLVAEFGTTAFCTSFGSAPGVGIVCNEFANELVKAGTWAVSQTASVVAPVAQAALNFISTHAGRFGCAIGFYCKSESDPNRYKVDLGTSGEWSIDKFDLQAIWKQDYAARIDEGVRARLHDPQYLKRMLAPVNIAAPPRYLEPNVQLGWATINPLAAKNDGPVWLYTVAFDPFQRELNARWAKMVFDTAAKQLENDADRFSKLSANWMKLTLPIEAEKLFDRQMPMISFQAERREVLGRCIATIEDPTRALQRWGAGAALVGDTTVLEGRSAAKWGQIKDWCTAIFLPAFDKEIAERKTARVKAIAGGCKERDGGLKGLTCPAPVGIFTAISGPMAQCQRAYKGSEKAYCLPAPTAIRSPGLRPATQPSPAPSPAPPPRIRPKVLLPGT